MYNKLTNKLLQMVLKHTIKSGVVDRKTYGLERKRENKILYDDIESLK